MYLPLAYIGLSCIVPSSWIFLVQVCARLSRCKLKCASSSVNRFRSVGDCQFLIELAVRVGTKMK